MELLKAQHKWYLNRYFLSGVFLLVLSALGGSIVGGYFLPDYEGVYGPFIWFRFVFVSLGPLSFYWGCYLYDTWEGSLISCLMTLLFAVLLFLWWWYSIKKSSYWYFLPIIIWFLCGSAWFVLFAGISV